MTTYRLFPSTSGPSAATSFSGAYGTGTKFQVTAGGLWLAGFWWWVCATGSQSTAAQPFCLWQVTASAAGILLSPGVSVTSGTLSAGWNYVPLATPVALTQGATYQAATAFSNAFPLTNSQYATGGAYAAGIVNGPLTAFSDGTGTNPDPYSNSQCAYQTSSTDPTVTFATDGDSGFNGWLDVQVTDQAPAGASYRIWPDYPDVLVGVSSDTTGYILATEFSVSAASALDRIWHYSPSGAASLPTRCSIWNVSTTTELSGAGNTSPAWLLPGGASASAGGGWVYCDYTSAGVTLAAGTSYKVATYHASGSEWMAVTPDYWSTGAGTSGITNGVISAPNSASASPGQGSYETTWSYPSLFITGGENYWVDAEVTPLTATAVLPVPPLPVPPGRLSPAAFRFYARPVSSPAAAVNAESGSLAVALPALTTALAGATGHKGPLAVTLPTLTTSLAGTAQHTESGSLAIALPTLTTTLTGADGHNGALAVTLPAVATSLAGTAQHTESGSFTVTLPTPATSLTGADGHGGALSVVLPAMVTSLNAARGGGGAFTITLPALVTSLAGTAQHTESGPLAVVLPALVSSLTGAAGHKGPFTVTLPTLATLLAGTSQHTESGPFTVTLPALVTSLTGTNGTPGAVTGAFLIELPPGKRDQAETGPLALPLPALSLSLTGEHGRQGALQLALPALVTGLAGHAPVVIPGAFTPSLPVPVTGLTGKVAHCGPLGISFGIPGDGLTRFQMFGAESRGAAVLTLPVPRLTMAAQVPDEPGTRSHFRLGRWISARLPRKYSQTEEEETP
ncbi:MAG TPA: hypothetical protein VGG75_38395 [Trebonia sp.]|jgi:hypothetical protein